MMRARLRTERLVLSGMGLAGLLAAHAISYWVVVPSGVHRHELLVASGHGYWPHAALVGLLAGVIAALVTAGAELRSRARGVVPDAIPLVLVQCGAFLALEAIERLGSGPAAGTLLTPLIAVGLLLQVLVALAAVRVLRLLVRVVVALVSARRPRPRAAASTRWPRSRDQIVATSLRLPRPPARAPPFVLP